MLWFIIYLTITGWQIQPIHNPPPNMTEQCHFSEDRPSSAFCIVSVDVSSNQAPVKTTSRNPIP